MFGRESSRECMRSDTFTTNWAFAILGPFSIRELCLSIVRAAISRFNSRTTGSFLSSIFRLARLRESSPETATPASQQDSIGARHECQAPIAGTGGLRRPGIHCVGPFGPGEPCRVGGLCYRCLLDGCLGPEGWHCKHLPRLCLMPAFTSQERKLSPRNACPCFSPHRFPSVSPFRGSISLARFLAKRERGRAESNRTSTRR